MTISPIAARGPPGMVRMAQDYRTRAAGRFVYWRRLEKAISPAALLDRIGRGEAPAIVDVRSPGEFAGGHVPGAVNIPFASVLAQPDLVPAPTSEPVVVYCGHGPRAWLAGKALRRRGYARVIYMRGHMAAWRRAGLREER